MKGRHLSMSLLGNSLYGIFWAQLPQTLSLLPGKCVLQRGSGQRGGPRPSGDHQPANRLLGSPVPSVPAPKATAPRASWRERPPPGGGASLSVRSGAGRGVEQGRPAPLVPRHQEPLPGVRLHQELHSALLARPRLCHRQAHHTVLVDESQAQERGLLQSPRPPAGRAAARPSAAVDPEAPGVGLGVGPVQGAAELQPRPGARPPPPAGPGHGDAPHPGQRVQQAASVHHLAGERRLGRDPAGVRGAARAPPHPAPPPTALSPAGVPPGRRTWISPRRQTKLSSSRLPGRRAKLMNRSPRRQLRRLSS